MNCSKSPVIAVVTALANGFAEKELLRGIISENRKNGYATVVIANIYNMVQQDNDKLGEQRIYGLAKSEEICGIILLCESFVEGEVRRKLAEILSSVKVPIIGAGTRLDEFDCLDYTRFDTSDIMDIEELTSHLIEEHGFTDIAFLTGMKFIESSNSRVEGFLKAMKKHGIEPDINKIYYGDFWLNSGEELAMKYVTGELEMPQAVICANDMMAYGMLRCFSENGISVLKQISVVSYEYSDLRMYYYPSLTSYSRNRQELGRFAAEYLQCVINGRTLPEFVPPKGSFIYGSSCPCTADREQSLAELRNAERRRNNNELCLFSTMEHKLTLCRDMEEFIHIIGDHQWMMQGHNNIFMCLYSDWYDTGSDSSEVIQARTVQYWRGSEVVEMDQYDLRTFFELDRGSSVCYLNPLFSGEKFFGYMAMLYDSTESYDEVYRHWLKSVSIGLEFLRLKNDIRYLISCQNVSEYRDTLTGMRNEKGLRRDLHALKRKENTSLSLIMLRIDLFTLKLSEEEIRRKTDAVTGAAKAVSDFCGSSDISGRISEDTFVCIVQRGASPEVMADLLGSILIQESLYMNSAGMGSFCCCGADLREDGFDGALKRVSELVTEEHKKLAAMRKDRYFKELIKLRNEIYTSPDMLFERDSDIVSADSIDVFRRKYKACFGVTFHRDCINARLARARYCLAVTSVSIAEISEKCGYIDYKYFQRQFSAYTGIPAMQYRMLVKN